MVDTPMCITVANEQDEEVCRGNLNKNTEQWFQHIRDLPYTLIYPSCCNEPNMFIQ